MERKTFKTTIDATRQKVWDTLWGTETYPKWTSAFAPGSKVETDWQLGSRALFLDVNGDGMISEIAQKREPEFLSFRHIGEIMDGKEDTESDKVKAWAGSTEDYTLTEIDGQTEVSVEMDVDGEYAEFFEKTWPRALDHLKSLSEEKGSGH
ncbi:SRPBCC family protein [Flavobacterium selenitireducens]|uniref:SRPBCC family protein n=1 Tax=Flavobacterium selenitireducens TaxID=2722704 RepID=UPI00168B2F5D|nr:SRPBCC domain-containing protein [Flavobacterium selenitireducens]MBD3583575.1 SRPBCC domain-containing protein [Flavobacterium selenitireducens]